MNNANRLKSKGKVSAGLLMYRLRDGQLQVLLAHPGGPLFAKKDEGHWTIPKGEIESGEDLLAAAIRLGPIEQKGGKIVHAWAFPGDWDESQPLQSNTFELEWPPGSGKIQSFEEIDRVEFFSIPEAGKRLKEAQHPFLDRLQAALKG